MMMTLIRLNNKNMNRIKKWLNNFRNQVLVYFTIMSSVPLLLLGLCNFLSGCIIIGLWVITMTIIIYLHFYTSDKAIEKRLKGKK